MTTKLNELQAEALKLPVESREFLADMVLGSVDREDNFELSEEWKVEIAGRVAEVEAGVVETIPLEEALADIRARLAAVRPNDDTDESRAKRELLARLEAEALKLPERLRSRLAEALYASVDDELSASEVREPSSGAEAATNPLPQHR